jgi:hypothetical protein
MSSTSLISLLGEEDNLSEPIPLVNRKATILGVVITFMILSWLCAIFRIYVRFFVIYAPGWDDLFLGLYLCSTTFGSIILCLSKSSLTLRCVMMGDGTWLTYETPQRPTTPSANTSSSSPSTRWKPTSSSSG